MSAPSDDGARSERSGERTDSRTDSRNDSRNKGRTDARIDVRSAACEIAAALTRAGFEAYFAGGCVRDRLLGLTPRDYDIATKATPDDIRAIFPKARGVGEAFGVMLVRHAGHMFEVSTFREEGVYVDGRRPSEVHFSDAEADAQRRDFTINGLFERPDTGEVVDFVGGRADFEARVVRAIGDPHARICDDRLRMLRAPRFAARFEFALDPRTADAIRAHAGELLSVSAERVGDELRRMLRDRHRARAAQLVEELGLDSAAFAQRVVTSAFTRLAALSADAPFSTALAAWWLDRFNATSDALPRPDDAACRDAVATLRRRLVLSNEEMEAILALLSAREILLSGFAKRSLSERVRASSTIGFDAALDVLAAEAPHLARLLREQADRENPTRSLPKPLLDGGMLLRAGLVAGPQFKALLDATLDAQIEGELTTMQAALTFALERARSQP